MAVATDATSFSSSAALVTSISWSHTVAADADGLYVAISIDGVGGSYTYDASATYDGAAMVRIHEATTNQYLAVFRLLAPAAGANTVQVSWTGAQWPAAVALSLKGVDQTTPEGAVSSSTNASGTSYGHVISAASGGLTLTIASVNNTVALTPTGATALSVETSPGAPYTLAGIGTAASGASVSVGFSWAAANRYSGASFAVIAGPTPPPTPITGSPSIVSMPPDFGFPQTITRGPPNPVLSS